MNSHIRFALAIGLSLSGCSCTGPMPNDGGVADAGADASSSVCAPHDGAGLPSSLTLAEFHAAYLRAICTSVFACPMYGDDFTYLRGVDVDVDQCVAGFAPLFADDDAAIAAAVSAGDIVYSGTAASSCLASLGACALSPIDAFGDAIARVPGCENVFVGQVAPNGACSIEEACAPGSHCERGASGCSGTCVADLTAGTDCDDDSECALGHRCDFTDGCVPLAFAYACGETSECGSIAIGGVETEVVCPPGLACIDARCAPPFAADAPCDDLYDAPCVAGYECLLDSNDEPRCLPVTTTATVDAVCGFDPDVIYCDARAGLFCDEAGACEAIGTKVGDPCDPYFDFGLTCASGLYCDENDFTCATEKDTGAPCDVDSECASHSCDTTCAASYCALR